MKCSLEEAESLATEFNFGVNYDRNAQAEMEQSEDSVAEDVPNGQHWLSNSFIISSLSGDDIKRTISYHQSMARLLIAELSARETGLRARVTRYCKSNRQDGEGALKNFSSSVRERRDNRKGCSETNRLVKAKNILNSKSIDVNCIIEYLKKKKEATCPTS